MTKQSKTVFTGLQPTSMIHLGNYLGAIKPLLVLQNNPQQLINTPVDKLRCCVADLHGDDLCHRVHVRQVLPRPEWCSEPESAHSYRCYCRWSCRLERGCSVGVVLCVVVLGPDDGEVEEVRVCYGGVCAFLVLDWFDCVLRVLRECFSFVFIALLEYV